jgi:hypothetical protein
MEVIVMSDTFRKVPNDVIDFVKKKKIIRNDKKHQQMILEDGAFSHPCYFSINGYGVKIGFNDIFDGLKTPKEKKFAKHISVKKQRAFKKINIKNELKSDIE